MNNYKINFLYSEDKSINEIFIKVLNKQLCVYLSKLFCFQSKGDKKGE